MSRRRYFPDEALEELQRAVRADEIENATEFAREFAARYSLNPETVRSTISRLRRQMGLVREHSFGAGGASTFGAGGASTFGIKAADLRLARSGLSAVDLLAADPANPQGALLGAAVLLRYHNEDESEYKHNV